MLKALAAQPAEELDYPGVKGVLLFVVEAGKERLKLGFDAFIPWSRAWVTFSLNASPPATTSAWDRRADTSPGQQSTS